jgi:hypothetical protein
MGEERGVHRVLVGKPEGKNHWGDPDVDGRIILTFWHPNFFNFFSTPCIYNVNNTGNKKGSIMT